MEGFTVEICIEGSESVTRRPFFAGEGREWDTTRAGREQVLSRTQIHALSHCHRPRNMSSCTGHLFSFVLRDTLHQLIVPTLLVPDILLFYYWKSEQETAAKSKEHRYIWNALCNFQHYSDALIYTITDPISFDINRHNLTGVYRDSKSIATIA